MSKHTKLQESFAKFVQVASQPGADEAWLKGLCKLTGQADVPTMISRFQKLAGIKPAANKKSK